MISFCLLLSDIELMEIDWKYYQEFKELLEKSQALETRN